VKALVLGGSGHIGNAVVREMLARGYNVSVAGRRTDLPINLSGLQIAYLTGDHEQCGQVEAWIAGHDLIVDAAAAYPLDLDSDTSAPRRRTLELLAAARAHGAVLAYISSFTTLKKWRYDLLNLPSRLAAQLHPYFELKRWMETQVIEAARHGLRVVIVNPTLCLGPWDLHPRELCLIPRLLDGDLIVSPSHTLNVIDVRDVASGLVSAVEAQRYGMPNLFSGHNVSGELLFGWICEVGNVRPPVLSMPASVSAYLGYWWENVMRSLGTSTPYNSLAAMLVYQHEWMPPSRALRDLGVRIRPLYETLVDSVHWYQGIGYC
jgi:dihydroflavonol-4-reductase